MSWFRHIPSKRPANPPKPEPKNEPKRIKQF